MTPGNYWTLLAIVVSMCSFFLTFRFGINQLKTTISSQLHEKAKEANQLIYKAELTETYTYEAHQNLPPKYNVNNIEGILDALVSTKYVLNYWRKAMPRFYALIKEQDLKELFYLQLNVYVRENIKVNNNFERAINAFKNSELDSPRAIRLEGELNTIQKFLEEARIKKEEY